MIVSPYLQTISGKALYRHVKPFLAAGNSRTGFYPDLCEILRSDRLRFIFENIYRRIVVVTADEHRRLAFRSKIPHKRRIQDWRASDKSLDYYREHRLVVAYSDALRMHNLVSLEIETLTHCNYRCRFCPVGSAPKAPEFMKMGLYGLILDRAAQYGIKSVSLHHYSEPSLDPDVVERVQMAADRDLLVWFFTNASRLTSAKIAGLKNAGNVKIVVNLPSVDPAEYNQITGSKRYDAVMRSLYELHEASIPVCLLVNAPRRDVDRTMGAVRERLAGMFDEIEIHFTDSRAGSVTDDSYVDTVSHKGLLGGCMLNIRQMSVSCRGEAFICSQDYDQYFTCGDLRTQSIAEIAEGDKSQQIRKWLFGFEAPPSGFLCTRCHWTREGRRDSRTLTIGSNEKWASYESRFYGSIAKTPRIVISPEAQAVI